MVFCDSVQDFQLREILQVMLEDRARSCSLNRAVVGFERVYRPVHLPAITDVKHFFRQVIHL